MNFYQYINALETDVHLINPRNNLERYGFTYVLKEKWGKLYLPRSFCEWVHGWYWWQEDLQIGDLIYERDKLPLSQWLLVTNEVEQKLAHDGGIKNVVPAGLPLLYATPTKLPEKRSNTLLAFIEHSAEDEIDHDVVETKFLDYLADVKKDFETVAVSIYGLDYSDKTVRNVKRRGLTPLLGAHPTDKNSFERICNYFSYFSNVTGNSMGSYVAYALYFGADVFLPGDFYKRDYSIFKKANPSRSNENISRMEYFFSETYAREHYSFLFKRNNEITISDRIALGNQYLGTSYKLERTDIERYLGWGQATQFKEYIGGGLRRIKRTINYQINLI